MGVSKRDAHKGAIEIPETPRCPSFDARKIHRSHGKSQWELKRSGGVGTVLFDMSELRAFIQGVHRQLPPVNEDIIRTALALIQHFPTDLTLRAGLLVAGHAPDDVDRHLEYMVEERLVAAVPVQGGPLTWRLKLRGKDLVDQATKPSLGFQLN